MESLSGSTAPVNNEMAEADSPVILAGTIGYSSWIQDWADQGILDISSLENRWDGFRIFCLENKVAIVGSNKRGTIYGIYTLSQWMGVSPWHWWADVPIPEESELFLEKGVYDSIEPAVKYRGFFINDEYPCLGEMAKEQFGGFNHAFYTHVFELLLRLRGNYFWPAMWDDCFHDDDPENTRLADELGIVMGTSHHEPLMRAWKEWPRYGKGDWNLETNREFLKQYWRDSLIRQGDRECILTVGMRGDGDEPLTEDSKEELLLDILQTQRDLIQEVYGKDPSEIPQLWAVYKEVYDYYEKGVSIPDDITMMLCDDNWGNLQKLPKESELNRPGGFGLYYHFDYVGGPRNYKWVNSSPLPRVWEQLNMALTGGIDRIWIVNVGDIKPLEYPLSFFMDYAWNPAEWSAGDLHQYTQGWAAEQFSQELSEEIADILEIYSTYNGLRKPELLGPDTYSQQYYREAERIEANWNRLAERVRTLKNKIPDNYRDSFYELVEYPVLASANLHRLHILTGRNRWYASQGRAAAWKLADEVEQCFQKDKELAAFYNEELAQGKWPHMMDQTHISYTYWQQPEKDVLPDLVRPSLVEHEALGLYIEGSGIYWPKGTPEVQEISSLDISIPYIDIFNRGKKAFSFKIKSSSPWITLEPSQGKVEMETRIQLNINWTMLSPGGHQGSFVIEACGQSVEISLPVQNISTRTVAKGAFLESNGVISILAEHFNRKKEPFQGDWTLLPGHGRYQSAMTYYPLKGDHNESEGSEAWMEYLFYLHHQGACALRFYFSPTNNTGSDRGLRFAYSIDEQKPVCVNMHSGEIERAEDNLIREGNYNWYKAVADNCRTCTVNTIITESGLHTLKYHLINTGLVLQKIEILTETGRDSYLGAPESRQIIQ